MPKHDWRSFADQIQFFFRLLLRVPVWPVAAFIEWFYRPIIFLLPTIDTCSTNSIFPCGFCYLLPFDNLFYHRWRKNTSCRIVVIKDSRLSDVVDYCNLNSIRFGEDSLLFISLCVSYHCIAYNDLHETQQYPIAPTPTNSAIGSLRRTFASTPNLSLNRHIVRITLWKWNPLPDVYLTLIAINDDI